MVKYKLSTLTKARHVNEPISNIIYDRVGNISTWLIANFTKINPNAVTTIGSIIGIIGAYFFITNQLFLGAICYYFRHLSDCIDGRLSRLKGQGSKFGAWYENYAGIQISFLNIIGFCVGQYLVTEKIIWLIFMPLLMHSFRVHNWSSMKIALLLGDKFKDKVVKPSKEKKGSIDKIKSLLSKLGIAEPFNSADGMTILFVLNPILGPLFGITLYVIIAWLIIIALKEIFWFFYYKNILNNFDVEKSKNKKKRKKFF